MKRSHLQPSGCAAVALAGAVAWTLVLAPPARAAELSLQAPAGCAGPAHVEREVEGLLRRPLGQVEGLRFEVHVAGLPAGRFEVRVVTLREGAEPAERRIAASSCGDALDAAAVAIAMVISEREREAEEWALPAVQQAPAATDASAAEAAASAQGAQPAPPDDAAAQAHSPWGLRLALGPAADVGTLPAIVAGVQLAVQGDYGPVGLRAYGAWFASAHAEAPNGLGAGDFQAAAVGALLCGQTPLATRLAAALCGGAEATYVSGAGADVDVSYERSVWFASVRADVALGWQVLEKLSLWLRVGLAVPLSQPTFVLNDAEPVHEVGTLVGRGALEFELTF